MSSSEQNYNDEDESCKHLRQKYQVGYRNPPVRTQFPKGQSGNPGGRPRGTTVGRAANLIRNELYRSITVREGDKAKRMPTLRAIIRSQVNVAAKGNSRVQRELIALGLMLDKIAAQATAKSAAETTADTRECSDLDLARWILSVFEGGAKEAEAQAAADKADKDEAA